jgi:spoIIIJ-associated protein
MAQTNEFEGKNVDAAVDLASETLNIPRDQIKYDVLSHGSTGIFGLVGAKKAKIRVKIAQEALPSGPPKRRRTPEKTAVPPEPENQETSEPSAPAAPKPPQKQRRRRSVKADKPEQAKPQGEPDPEPAPPISREELEAAAPIGREVLQRIVGEMVDDPQIEVDFLADRIRYEIKSSNAAVLIGKRGQTLEAVQYLVDKIVNKERQGRIRIIVDVEGYWENRKSSLKEMALRMAEKSKRTGKPITLGQMNAHDRRTIHLALKEDSEVKTQSRGEGAFRKLVIFPRKSTSRKRRQRKE